MNSGVQRCWFALGTIAAAALFAPGTSGSENEVQSARTLEQARALFDAGRATEADAYLKEWQASDKRQADPSFSLLAGRIALELGRFAQAQSNFESATMLAEDLPLSKRALLANEYGRLHASMQDPVLASRSFERAVKLSEQAGENASRNRYLLNLARARFAKLDPTGAMLALNRLLDELKKTPVGQSASADQLRNGAAGLLANSSEVAADKDRAVALWNSVATSSADVGQRSFAYGLPAEFFAREGDSARALELARNAAEQAQQTHAPSLLLRWEFLLGKLLLEDGEADLAASAFKRAITLLEPLRAGIVASDPGAYGSLIGPLYKGYADALLRATQSASADTAKVETKEPLLIARNAIEAMKVAEFQDFLGEECLQDDADLKLTERRESGTMLVYPIVLDDRTEILLSGDGQLSRHVVEISREELRQLATRLRRALQSARRTDQHLTHGRALYDLLIAPLMPELNDRNSDTLIFVPDGPLRIFPLAALHDGEQFLLQRFSIVTSVGLQLAPQSNLDSEGGALFAGGLSQEVQGFQALPGVDKELDRLASDFSATVYRNAEFTQQRLQTNLIDGGFDVMHVATHGSFGGTFEDSFLLTYDGRLTMGALGSAIEERREVTARSSQPLDLLVLSACETAIGDDRATLGLAGVAINAGAQSVVASLWSVEDAATAELVPQFYAALAQPDSNKASSLRAAQLKLLADPEFSHPSSWAPFLLIGDWQ